MLNGRRLSTAGIDSLWTALSLSLTGIISEQSRYLDSGYLKALCIGLFDETTRWPPDIRIVRDSFSEFVADVLHGLLKKHLKKSRDRSIQNVNNPSFRFHIQLSKTQL
jgi:hypothetical protein